MYANPDNLLNRYGRLMIMDDDTHQPTIGTWSVRYNTLELNSRDTRKKVGGGKNKKNSIFVL